MSKLVYKKSSVRESAQKIADQVQPVPEIRDLAPVPVTPGRKPDVVKDFGTDIRSNKMKNYILDGLSPREAGLMAGYSNAEMDTLQKKSAAYRLFVQKALIEFKQKHLKVIRDKADPKTSQWLLEKMFPEEFALRGKDAVGQGGDRSSTTIINAIFKSVQATPDELIPTKIYDIEDSNQEEQDDSSPQDNRGAEPSIEPGGANIIWEPEQQGVAA